ncbi:TetR/AcrR family transcriptional regulator [Bifidobacterium tsurumiense]|uniref:Transcriptional regulator n=1 Tax=Bifidobacterium tsurumiense TaxID=356829 RepID=A0A087ECG5_9BIFI|nr:TetR/AcrR family transcriptional regulator [Bifidobacterium tsurumiense]KFJ05466.1 transcriptional regulator [Bifidobacterium tsurumiense]MDY4677905.1 helix-turn-helix domain-containing protein [Bifidobacterium tsurumiense]
MPNKPNFSRQSPEQRQAQIIAVAARHFARDGVAGASISAIAQEAGITRALVYHYFPSKEQLFAAVLQHESKQLLMDTEPDSGKSARDNIEQMLRTMFERIAERDGLFQKTCDVTNRFTLDAIYMAYCTNHASQQQRILELLDLEDSDAIRDRIGAWMVFCEYLAHESPQRNASELDEIIALCLSTLEHILATKLD